MAISSVEKQSAYRIREAERKKRAKSGAREVEEARSRILVWRRDRANIDPELLLMDLDDILYRAENFLLGFDAPE